MSEVVYYLRRNDLIKIGWSGNLKARMRALRPDELLAVEPGCMHIETGRHHQFAEHRLPNTGDGDEWFRPAPELRAHIDLIARMHPTPDLAELIPQRTGPVRRGPLPRLVGVIPAVPAEDVAALGRAADLRDRDLSELSTEDLVSAVGDAELVFDRAPHWTGRLVAALTGREMSWADCARVTGLAPTTLRNRYAKAVSEAPSPASPKPDPTTTEPR